MRRTKAARRVMYGRSRRSPLKHSTTNHSRSDSDAATHAAAEQEEYKTKIKEETDVTSGSKDGNWGSRVFGW